MAFLSDFASIMREYGWFALAGMLIIVVYVLLISFGLVKMTGVIP